MQKPHQSSFDPRIMKKAIILIIVSGLLFCLLLHFVYHTDAVTTPPRAQSVAPDSIRLLFAGDVMGHIPQVTGAWHDGGDSTYNFGPVFQYAKPYILSADIALANLEVTFGGRPYSGYPRFSSPGSLAAALQEAGFDVLVCANNHAADRGRPGLEHTIDVLDRLGLAHTGTFKDSLSRDSDYPLLLECNNFRLALLNYTYDTNGLPVPSPNVVSLIDSASMAADLAKARRLQPDFIITFIHWGDEYQNRQGTLQQELAHFLAQNGCDLIVGSHPHVVQPFDKIAVADRDSVPVIYSLGNFVSNQRNRYCNGGITFEVTLVKADSVVRLASCSYEPFWVHRFSRHKSLAYRLIPVNDYLCHPSAYALDTEDRKLMMQFYNDTRQLLPRLPFSGTWQTMN
jgi:poly-gamma-glutamate synthesis protein (capsule biosynthesis protein)